MEKRIIEGIEACRPGSDDVHASDLNDVASQLRDDPAARVAYERAQKWDAAISAAMEQVPVPEGLKERLLDRLQAVASIEPAPGATVDLSSGVAVYQNGSSRPRWSRRRWFGAAASIAAGLLMATSVGLLWQPGAGGSVEMLADSWRRELVPTWQKMNRAPLDFAIPDGITASAEGWQRVGNLKSGRGVAYRLVRDNAVRATLFVVKMSGAALPETPPLAPQSTTGGKSVGYWRRGMLVYVLVVEGDDRSYRTFVSSAPTPLA
jgi:hypothetical protein